MKRVIFLLALFVVISSGAQDFKKYFEEYGVTGSFVMYDLNNDKYTYHDSARCYKGFIPASTFKIPNSIIGLETGVIEDENFVIPWDGIKRREPWDKDLSLKEAIKVSSVPYYQELARRVGEVRMKEMLEKLNYGNKDITAGIDKFWLEGNFRISQMEQIDFLKRMRSGELPVSKRAVDIVEKMIILDVTSEQVLRGKTGWGDQNGKNIGWLVGWVEKGGNVYFYATNIESEKETDTFVQARREITEKILSELGALN
jgi:beta-lactamase class D